MSPISTSGGYHFRCPTGDEHISRLLKHTEVRNFSTIEKLSTDAL
jgi:hypothetical protein